MAAMSYPLSIPAGLPVTGSVASPLSTPSVPRAPETKPVQLYANPSFRLDPTVGLVVMELHDNTGAVTTIPSQRQLEAYRTGQQTPPGEQPPPTPQATDGKIASG
jgi:hypothetical protein